MQTRCDFNQSSVFYSYNQTYSYNMEMEALNWKYPNS